MNGGTKLALVCAFALLLNFCGKVVPAYLRLQNGRETRAMLMDAAQQKPQPKPQGFSL